MFEEINRHCFFSTEAMTSSRIIRLSLVGMILASFVGVGAFRAQSSLASTGQPTVRAKTRSGDARNAAKPTLVLVHGAFGASVAQPAWKTIPSWYLVTQEDRAINPDLERFYAKRIGAKTTEIRSSHVPFISHPAEVARLIEQAAR